MDPLTHTLVGANLASTQLGRKTRLAAAATIVGANLPDVDAILYFTGHSDLALGFRRGWTHGVLALAVLPCVLTVILLLYARLRPRDDRPVDAGWILFLSAFSILTHPFLDWLNNYGMRWLMPFRGTWSYGDSVFIMDPWLWLVLGGGWLAGREPSRGRVILWGVLTLALGWVVMRRSPAHVAVVGVVSIVLLLLLLWRPKKDGRGLALVSLIVAAIYIGARLLIHAATVGTVRGEFARRGVAVERLMVSPLPLDPLTWEVVAEVPDVYRHGRYRWIGRSLQLDPDTIPRPRPTREWEIARRDPSIRGFMTWVRFPWYEIERTPSAIRVHVGDARYARFRTRGFGSAVVTIPLR